MANDRIADPSAEVVRHQCRENIRKYGWHCQGVLAAGKIPAFNYTVGVHVTHRPHPELAVFGLDPRTGYMLLAAAVNLIEDGTGFEPGRDYERVAQGFPVRVQRAAIRESQPFAAAKAFYGFVPEYLELVWPDPQGVFPGEPGCEALTASLQRPR
jgi:Domain of unknown function (DUF4262)